MPFPEYREGPGRGPICYLIAFPVLAGSFNNNAWHIEQKRISCFCSMCFGQKVNDMRRLHNVRLLLVLILMFMAGCGGVPQSDDPLPTLAQLPTLPPSPLPATLAASPTEVPPVPSTIPTLPTTREAVRRPTSGPTPELPLALQGATATLPFNLDMDVFPQLKVGDAVTLQGRLSVKGDEATLTDSEGNSIIVLVDPFVAQVANGEMVMITGEVIEQGGKQAVQMTAITVLGEVTSEVGGVPGMPPLPTGGVPPLPTEGVPPLPTSS